jgi:hypothetical protein
MSGGVCCLYRHFDKNRNLLYVGISLTHMKRLSTHRLHADWFLQIKTVEIEHFKDRKTAMQAEREAIAHENPMFNIMRPEVKYPLKKQNDLFDLIITKIQSSSFIDHTYLRKLQRVMGHSTISLAKLTVTPYRTLQCYVLSERKVPHSFIEKLLSFRSDPAFFKPIELRKGDKLAQEFGTL